MAQALKIVSQKTFNKGIVAVSNRFSVPKGAVMQALNFLLTERAALQVCDGTLIQSVLPNPTGAILTLGLFEDTAFNAFRLALASVDAGDMRLYNWNTNPAVDISPGGNPIPSTPGWFHPQIFQFAGFGIITLGNQVPIQLFDGATLTAINVNASWQANHFFAANDRIVEAGNTYFVSTLSITSAAGLGTGAPIPTGGFSGSAKPNFQNTDIAGTTLNDNQIVWMCVKQASADLGKQTAPLGCAHAINHAGALWAWNTNPTNRTNVGGTGGADGPSVLRQSSLNNPNSWPNAYMAYVGRDDGQQGTGIGTFTIAESGIAPTGSLVLFKEFSTYQVLGVFGASDFAIQQVKTDMGCIAGRTVQFATGAGLIRLTHRGIAVFNGTNDDLLSEEIRPYIFGRSGIAALDFANAINSRAALVENPPMYICGIPTVGSGGAITRILCYDLVMKAWMIVSVCPPISVSAINQLRIPGLQPTTFFGDAGTGGAIRRWQSGDPDWDGVPIQWGVQPAEIGDPGSRAYFRRVQIRLHAKTAGTMNVQSAIASALIPTISNTEQVAGPSSSGIYGTQALGKATYVGDQDLAVAFDIAQTAESARAIFTGSGKVVIEGFDWHVMAKPTRVFNQAV